jgi:hypothetical protein
MWRSVDLVWTDVSEESIAPIFSCSHLLTLVPRSADFSTLMMEAIPSPETSAHIRATRRYILEDGILQRKKNSCFRVLSEPS